MGTSFRDIKADVMARITGGVWRPGALVPGEAELAESYGCARATVNRAMRELAEEGYLDRRRKSGTRVRAAPTRHARFEIPLTRNEVEARGAKYRYALISRAVSIAPDWLRARLGLGPGTCCLHVICLHSADGRPFQHEDRWINLTRLGAAEDQDFSTRSPNEWLVETVPFSEVELSFSAVAADAAIAEHLGCAPADPLFQMERATWMDGAPVTFVQLSYAPGYRMTTRY